MSDLSPLVPWITAALGCGLAYGIARLSLRPSSFIATLFAGAKAFALSIVSFFVGSLIHGLCMDPLHRCVSHGDGNLSYAMGGVLAFPLFWLIICLFGKGNAVEQAPSLLSQCASASSTAIMDHAAGKAASTRCPACADVIQTRQSKRAGGDSHIATSCSCGKCDRTFQLRAN